ncbi:hypothetical protein, partial [Yersinia pestis]|uniref:hypothetical protein n=1 Tax=Yersinia pestis TaxID=632 RepID=UPI00195525C8
PDWPAGPKPCTDNPYYVHLSVSYLALRVFVGVSLARLHVRRGNESGQPIERLYNLRRLSDLYDGNIGGQ